jgi:hypothetical protein
MPAGWGGYVTPAKPEPPRELSAGDKAVRVLDALYTHSPAGHGVLAAHLGFDPMTTLGELARIGKVVYRQVGDVTVYALTGAMGA